MDTPASTTPLPGSFFFKRKSREDLLREKIPTINDLPTKYRPCRNMLMFIPLPEQAETEGGIVLPDRSVIRYNEGHIVAMGPHCNSRDSQIGDCVTWNPHDELKMKVENVSFILLPENLVLLRISVSQNLKPGTTISIKSQSPQEVCNELADIGYSPEELENKPIHPVY